MLDTRRLGRTEVRRLARTEVRRPGRTDARRIVSCYVADASIDFLAMNGDLPRRLES